MNYLITQPKNTASYIRQDGSTVRMYFYGAIVSLVASNAQGNAVDSWDGLLKDRPARFAEQGAQQGASKPAPAGLEKWKRS